MIKAVLCVVLATWWTAPLQAQTLAAHEAKYSLRVGGAAGGQAISGGGSATIRIEKGCRAWRMHTFMSITIAGGGRTVVLKARIAMVESLDGLTYESQSRVTAGNHREESRIRATRTAGGGGEAVVIANTGRRIVQLPKGTRFPIGHARQTLRDAAAGKSRMSALVFDQEGSGRVLQVVDRVTASPVPPFPGIAASLRVAKAYRVKSKMFARTDTSGRSPPGLEEIVLANGVGLIMQASMGGLSLTGKLVSAKPLKPASCKT